MVGQSMHLVGPTGDEPTREPFSNLVRHQFRNFCPTNDMHLQYHHGNHTGNYGTLHHKGPQIPDPDGTSEGRNLVFDLKRR